MKKTANTCLAMIVAALLSRTSQAEIAVIVHPSATLESVRVEQVQHLYLGQALTLGGIKLIPIDQKAGSATRREFSEKALGQSEGDLAAYWSRRMFSGKGNPPRQYAGDREVIRKVSDHPGSIGYVDASSVDDRVKVVLSIP